MIVTEYISIVETWLRPDVTDAMLYPENWYNVHRYDRPSDMSGGYLFFVSEDVLSYRSPHVPLEQVEMTCITIIKCSGLALSTVLRMTSLSYRNMPFSGTHPTKTP
jgi:hypothetical protein